MQRYTYALAAGPGRGFDPAFTPELTPAEMLRRGVFEGKYLNDCVGEFPAGWFTRSRARRVAVGEPPDPSLNEFGVRSRMSLAEWRRRGWIRGPDVRGWFQWYCRYYVGRRMPEIDAWQIARWRSFRRHRAQLIAAERRAGRRRDPTFRPRQRQALLQWAYDPYP